MPGQRITTNIRAIDRKLATLERSTANKVARASVNAGLTVLVKAIRRSIDSSAASEPLKRAMKKTVGKRFTTGGKKAKYGVAAKAGLGVGKKKNASGSKDRSGRRGVGISANNVHWPALGTNARYTGQKSSNGGKGRPRKVRLTGGRRSYRGKMPQVPVVRMAGSDAYGSMRAMMEQKCREKLEELVK